MLSPVVRSTTWTLRRNSENTLIAPLDSRPGLEGKPKSKLRSTPMQGEMKKLNRSRPERR